MTARYMTVSRRYRRSRWGLMRHAESLCEVLADVGAEPPRHRQREAPPGTGEERGAAGARRPQPPAAPAHRDRVPPQRLLLRSPLPLEAISPRAAGRAAEVEPPEPLPASVPDRHPVQEHVRTQRQVRAEAGGPRHREDVLEAERDQAPDR